MKNLIVNSEYLNSGSSTTLSIPLEIESIKKGDKISVLIETLNKLNNELAEIYFIPNSGNIYIEKEGTYKNYGFTLEAPMDINNPSIKFGLWWDSDDIGVEIKKIIAVEGAEIPKKWIPYKEDVSLIKIGKSDTSKIFLGKNEVTSIYKGETLIWSK